MYLDHLWLKSVSCLLFPFAPSAEERRVYSILKSACFPSLACPQDLFGLSGVLNFLSLSLKTSYCSRLPRRKLRPCVRLHRTKREYSPRARCIAKQKLSSGTTVPIFHPHFFHSCPSWCPCGAASDRRLGFPGIRSVSVCFLHRMHSLNSS